MRGLTLLLACLVSASAQSETLEHVSTFEWPSEAFVGLSGLELSQDGQGFATISDRGWYLSGQFQRDASGITGVTLQRYVPILEADGLPVAARRVGDWSDAEGLAIAPDGTHWISFERWARVVRYPDMTAPGEWIKDHAKFYDYAENRQLEALALHPDGTLYTLPEQPGPDGFDLFRLEGSTWVQAGHIPPQNGFAIVGADFSPEGRLYLLERKLFLGLRWQSRVRSIDVERPGQPETLWVSALGDYHNLEGIAYWQDAGGPRLSLISDNNGDRDEVTQVVEFRILP